MRRNEIDLNRLCIYNLSTDTENSVLAFTQDWINAFAPKVERVDVYSTHLGKFKTSENVYLHETGGGSTLLRLRALYRLLKSSFKVFQHRKSIGIFHHMSVKTAIFPGAFFKLLKVPQVMWYSHSAVTPELRIATKIVDKVVTSVGNAFPIPSPKVVVVGHGLKFENESCRKRSISKNRSGIVYLGRIARIKNLDYLLKEMNRVNYDGQVDFIGPITDFEYQKNLKSIAEKGKYKLSFKPEISHEEIYSALNQYEFCYSGTPNSVDKATLEASSCGCIPISEMRPSIQLTGLDQAWKSYSIRSDLSVGDQLLAIKRMTETDIQEFRAVIVKATINMNEVQSTVSKIFHEILTAR
jgi:glycosyltransferase involved in cell wall biosynthesis